ncbi:L,D-transpeptidase family protein [Streptomyces sp. NA04227]|uniref:L,D-transpeptidase family protein n=1 Tax=Streptomyces sp. NA04227 TaxID=2742136 RepID=UPI0015920374|nr:L,D-transpeptidase family protein [Streptomyces sp. NA04227]QKW08777.1 L,D-transpeptidase family protein [Streptomyces sp. NA04227]
MRATVIRRSLAATATLAVATVTGCTAQAVDSKGESTPIRTSPSEAPAQPQKAPAHKPAAQKPAVHKPAAPAVQADSKPAGQAPGTAQQAAARPAAPKPVMAPGSEGPKVRELQARLRQLKHFDRSPTGYYGSITANSVSAFQGAHGLTRTGKADLKTWLKVQDLTDVPTRDELYPPTTRQPAKPDSRCLKGRVLCISKTSRTLQWMVNGKVLAAMDVRFGSQYTPTREGEFSVFWKNKDHVSTLYDTPMPYAMFFSGGQAVHYSSDFAARGYNGASHGCVNVRDKKKIAALFDQVKTGDKVVVYK